MKKLTLNVVSVFLGLSCIGQTNTLQPKIMVIPFTRDKEDIRTVLDEDVNRRIAITKVREGFDKFGYTTVDFVGKLKAARDNQVFTANNQSDIKSKIIEMSGADIYVIAEVNVQHDRSGASADVILSSYDVATGNSLSNKVGHSGKFYTNDYGKLTTKAIDKCVNEFVATMQGRLKEMEAAGRSVLVDFSFAENANVNLKTKIDKYNQQALSEVLESWFSKNSINSAYHVQGITSVKMIFDDVKIPITKANGAGGYSTNEFAVQICKFLSSIGLSADKVIKAGTIFITIN